MVYEGKITIQLDKESLDRLEKYAKEKFRF